MAVADRSKKTRGLGQLLRRPITIYAIAALLVLLPMLAPGYIFALDMVFTPRIRMPEYVSSSYPFYALLHVLNVIVPSQILQKALLMLILILSGYGMHRLFRYMQGNVPSETGYSAWGAYVSGLLYMINPFTYSRFMVGQFAVLLGYACIPFFVRALCIFGERPARRTALILAGWCTVIGIVSIHTVGIVVLLALVVLLLFVCRHHSNIKHLLSIFRHGSLIIGLVLLANSYWVVPLAIGNSTTAQAISGFTEGDQQAFSTVGDSLGDRVANVLQLQGFWAEARHMYALPQERLPVLWTSAMLLSWCLIITGVAVLAKHRQYFTLSLLCGMGIIGVVLACTNITETVARYIPLFAGYREPQKFVAMVAVAFAVLIGYGVTALIKRLQEWSQETAAGIAAVTAISLPALLTPTMLWGFGGQLKPRNYPPDWAAVNRQLTADPKNVRVLFVPWHQYMSFGFTGRITANPATQFFDRQTIVSNELELGQASPTVPDPEKVTLGTYLSEAASGGGQLATRLAAHNIKYVILAKENDYQHYAYLNIQPDFEIVQDTPTLRLYRNMAHGRSYGP